MTNWEIFKRLCLIIGGQHSSALAEAIDQDCFGQLTAMAEQRDLLPALATRLDEQNGLKTRVPADLKGKLKQALADNTQRKLQIKAQAIKLARALNTAGIEPLFLKGTAQLLTSPNMPVGSRKQVDIDLLVPLDQIEASCEALKNDGYLFYDFDRPKPGPFSDIAKAQQISADHHHLPPMAKSGYSATIELHKQPLRRRFQKALPAEHLLISAISCEAHGASFQVPSSEHQLLHLILGEFIHDGYAARFDFPMRAGRDYIDIVSLIKNKPGGSPGVAGTPDFNTALQLFEQLVCQLMGLPDEHRLYPPCTVYNRLKITEKRLNSTAVASLLDMQARWRYLALSLWYDAGKMQAYLNRRRKPTAVQSGATGHR